MFFAFKHYMMFFFLEEGPKKNYFLKGLAHGVPTDEVFVYHNLGVNGMQLTFYEEIERAFFLPTYGRSADNVFDHVKLFANQWNINMAQALIPGECVTVNESMGGWTGKAMYGLMHAHRKPTPNGQESRTTACSITGVIIRSMICEGNELMSTKKHIQEHGKNPAKAPRYTEKWQVSVRTVILDSGFMDIVP